MGARRTIRTLVAVFMAAAAMAAAAPAMAAINHYDVRIDGLACPFCVRGLQKKLGELPGVSDVHVSLESGTASFDVAESTVLLPDRVRAAVTDAGFTARGYTVRARGSVIGDGPELSLDIGEGHALALRGGAALDELRALVRDGVRSVVVTGAISSADDAWRLSVDGVAADRSQR